MARYIFITGGVVSSLGKGLLAASSGLSCSARLLLRIRSSTPISTSILEPCRPISTASFLSPTRRRDRPRSWPYERYTGVSARQSDNITSGRIYQGIIARERRGDYLGATVQVVPHVTNAIEEFALADTAGLDFVICEIGGTVGDIESLPFVEAIRQLRNDIGRANGVFVHTTLVPWIAAAGELKTKPTQH